MKWKGVFIMAMAASNRFSVSLKQGRVAEGIVTQVFSHAGWAYLDVSDNPECRKMGIDFILIDRLTGEKKTLEVKSDKVHQYGNFSMEHVSNKGIDSPGWALTTKSDYIAIYFSGIDTIFLLDGHKTVEWFTANQHRFKEMVNGTKSEYNEKTLYPSKFRLVSRKLYDKEVGIIAEIVASDYLATA